MRPIDADALLEELKKMRFPGAPYVDAGVEIAIGKVCETPNIEALPPTQKEQRWIPCDEQLPKENENVLVADDCEMISVCSLTKTDGGYKWENYFGYYEDFFDWTAWMPLPEPYRKEGEA